MRPGALVNRRIRLLLAALALAFGGIFLRAVWIQGVRAASLSRLASSQHRETVALGRWGHAQRERFPGIVDRRGGLAKVRERDWLMDELIVSACDHLDLRWERVDGSRDLDASLALLEEQFGPLLPATVNA